ncbi:MAG TPA: tail fiber domain-containing protein, partial [Flavobacteriales bacterium]|nr:tail fiber domain-containing protein [Flavobacteriales bacterium]
MRLSPTLTGQNWGWFNTNSLDLSGHLGIGSPTPQRPLTYLHLNSSLLGGITVGYRPWMRVGVFSTQGTDGMYAGMRALDGRTEAVINWSDDDNANFAQDNLTFVFTSTPDSSSTASRFRELEVARMIPALNGNEGFFGVGDWRTAGLQPTERLDLLDGRARFRELTDPANEANGTYKVMVVDDAAIPSGERGGVKWVDPSDLPGNSSSCDWVVQPLFPHVSTAYDPSGCPWDRRHGVGIGLPYPKFKLHVQHLNNEFLDPKAMYGDARFDLNNGAEVVGVFGLARTVAETGTIYSMRTYGVVGRGQTAKFSTGVLGLATTTEAGGGTAVSVVGVDGVAEANENSELCIGVRGRAGGALYGENWAIWSEGDQFSTTTGTWTTSDASFKTNVLPVEDAMEKIMLLRPSTYNYRTDEYPYLNLSTRQQYGMVAQEFEAVLPELVRQIRRPADLDSLGNEVSPALTFKAVNYEQLIPILVAGIQEQTTRIERLEELLAACCANPDGSRMQAPTNTSDPVLDDPSGERKLRIVPNPFNESTTVFYTLERGG